jgi:sec-independent protein translocase protein TatA
MGISIWQLLIILAIVLVIFGAKRLRNLGGDLGGAVKNFREAVKNPDQDKEETAQLEHDAEDAATVEKQHRESDKV